MDDDEEFDSSSMDFDEPAMANPASLLYGTHQYDYITSTSTNTSTNNTSTNTSTVPSSSSSTGGHRTSFGDIMRFGRRGANAAANSGNGGSAHDDDDVTMGSGSGSGVTPRGFKSGAPDEKVVDRDFFNKFDDDFDDEDMGWSGAVPNAAPAPTQQAPNTNAMPLAATNTHQVPAPPSTK
ncbi:hypothetical protein SeMB42_g05729 [Synchytrium endobioticum]|uniref:Uncharacterized protein n=1 Tax=Synchytrium endobioticum TaxID=286115 RepID=A0A507CPS2_9FUNG|nr:hypothetical protein SeMB42_g05729 [Synchytrium endobioticum]TPX47146.1 hypothetical protein SeLEV6574_g02817 [Synchytrium endobioticum]